MNLSRNSSLGFPNHTINLAQYDAPAFQGHKNEGRLERLSLPILLSFLGIVTLTYVIVCIVILLCISKHPNSPSGVREIELQNPQESEGERRGVEEAIIDRIPVIVFLTTEETSLTYRIDLCPICNEDFVLRDRLMVLPSCRHAFHVVCITRHMARNDKCPYCRQHITSTLDGNEV